MADTIIELVDLTKKYGSFTAVDQLNLTVAKGEVFGLLGPNGAGKSTTILMMLGLTEPSSGHVLINGLDSSRQPIEVKRKVGYLPEDVGFYDDLSGLENLVYTARLNGIPEQQATNKALQLLERVGLRNETAKKAGKYSRGMRQRLGLADVLIKSPEIIILDEPTLGIDPAGIRQFLELIVSLSKEEEITVLFSSHNLHQVQRVCDRVGIFVKGRLLAVGNIQELSMSLFSNNPYLIEVSINGTNVSSGRYNPDWLHKTLAKVDGIAEISMRDEIFQISCYRDIGPEIARAIVQSGAPLASLNKKEYGLDDIYYRYFEGGENHG